MREKAITFGAGNGLMGVLTEGAATGERPVVLFSNVGVSHRVGPFRLNVELARRLAAMGFSSFRFDFSGLGDSEASRDGRTDQQRAVSEAQAAMDMLTERTGARRFVMVGLCSGADKTHLVARADDRIIGAVFIDGYAYKTLLFYLIRFTLRFLEWKRLKVFVKDRWSRLKATFAKQTEGAEAFRAIIASPDRKGVERDLAAMAARGCRQLHLFTVSTDYTYNYQGQFWHMYPALKGKGEVVTERYPGVDHTLSMVGMQKIFVDRICRWMEQFQR